MKIEKGRWVNDMGDTLTVFESKEIVSVGNVINKIFGDDITYDRIEIVNSLFKKNEKKEKLINLVLNDEQLFNKISGL